MALAITTALTAVIAIPVTNALITSAIIARPRRRRIGLRMLLVSDLTICIFDKHAQRLRASTLPLRRWRTRVRHRTSHWH